MIMIFTIRHHVCIMPVVLLVYGVACSLPQGLNIVWITFFEINQCTSNDVVNTALYVAKLTDSTFVIIELYYK